MSVVVLTPVLNRPERVRPLVESLNASQENHDLRLLFLVSPSDIEELREVERSGADWFVMPDDPKPGDYAEKMNMGLAVTTEKWVFLGADDLCYCPGWADAALAKHHETGKRVIGTNDLGNPSVRRGRHSTHTLMHRSYANLGSFDDPSKVLHEGYHHNWVDNEFVETAKWRGEFASARDSHVEHLHPVWHKGEDDGTYRRGREHYAEDGRLWRERERLLRKTPRLGGALKPRMVED